MIVLFKVHMPETVIGPLTETLFSGYIGEGPKVKEFENSLAEFIGNPYVLTLNSCTSALQLALRLSNVSYGDEVISAAMTCTATNEPIIAAGAKIVWADIDSKTGNIDPLSIEKKITDKTKAIMIVHWGGYPCDLDEINMIGNKYNIKVIEDAAHAFGAEYKGKKIGNHSDFSCFSFQAIKHITTVDGGALACKNEKDYQRGKLLRWYGIDRETNRKDFRCEEDVEEWGYKFHMNDVSATIGIEQMKYIENILNRQRDNANYYDNQLQNVTGCKLLSYQNDRHSAYWLYTILVDKREKFMKYMAERNIIVSQVHARNDKHTMFAEFKTSLLGVDKFTKKMICIPVGWWVTNEEREYIVQCIRNGW